MTSEALTVRTITAEEHLAVIRAMAKPSGGSSGQSASFLQTPAWAAVKPEWKAESIGWVSRSATGGESMVGAALVLYRQLPKIKRFLAYVPEGPLIDWESDDLGAWLGPMADHLRGQGAFGIRIGPPVVTRRWSAAQIKEGIADESVRSLTSLPPTERSQVGAGVRLTAAGARVATAGGRGRLRGRPAAVQLPHPARRRRGHPAQRGRCAEGHEPAVAAQHQEGRQAGRRDRARGRRPTSRPSTSSTSSPPAGTASPLDR